MSILVLNTGSSSLKYKLFTLDTEPLTVTAEGLVERIGEVDGPPDHAVALRAVFTGLEEAGHWIGGQLVAIGHRVVHGGETFDRPVRIDATVVDEIRRAVSLAPLHNPAAIAGIEAAMTLMPLVPQVAVFDTAFHQTMPPEAFRYALPGWCYEQYGVRRYGMHGTSHAYVCRRAAELLERPQISVNVISLHLGNGASVAAVAGGRCVETSMGLTPLEGLVMGTRSGDVDPAVPLFLCREANLSPGEVDRLLNRESGLKGLCGENDLRPILARAATGDVAAELTLNVYCHRIRKYIGAYAAVLGRVDALVFTAGVGENAAEVRQRVCANLELLGVRLDESRNATAPRGIAIDVSQPAATARVLIIPTEEEREIAQQTWTLVKGE